jgi:glutamate synthase domain-containing protein 3
MVEVAGAGRTAREINAEIKRLIAAGEKEILVREPRALHNLGVGIVQPVRLTFDGSVGYYGAGLVDGPTVEIRGSAGWGVAESMLNGTVVVRGHAGNGAAAAIRGGTVVVHGDAAARAGVSMKGGLLIVGGSCGYMAGFMGQKGTIVVCGDAGEAFADSMYETVCFVGGKVADLGNDAVVEDPTPADLKFLGEALERHSIPRPAAFRKIVAGRKLWNFDKREWTAWKEAL